ncbi:hypothetical protein FLP41_01895 (plasmid) [Paracoccus marcusii]|uniref:hypothetical protein n=1 Tax=Paracoccus marcusii TaxID=59779 RepID=UPI0012EFC10D|nr:hypothetical protein FLP41_01895 [Paracoccus marcusii]
MLLAAAATTLIVIHITTYSMIFLSGYSDNGLAGVIYSFVNLGGDNSISENLNHGMLFICFSSFLYVFTKPDPAYRCSCSRSLPSPGSMTPVSTTNAWE